MADEIQNTVNGLAKSQTTVNSNTVDGGLWTQIDELIKKHDITPEGMSLQIAELLDDAKSVSYYKLLIKEHNYQPLLRAAYLTKEAWSDGKIRTTRPIYFLAILRKWGYKTRFRIRRDS